jgi:hypothetical protein
VYWTREDKKACGDASSFAIRLRQGFHLRQGYGGRVGGRDGGLKAGMRMKSLPKVTFEKGVRSPSRKQADALTSALRLTT